MLSNLSAYSDPSEYAQEDLFTFLEGYQPTNVGNNYSYSNLGFATLGKALEFCQVYKNKIYIDCGKKIPFLHVLFKKNDGRDFKQLVAEEIVQPMGLHIFYDDPTSEQDMKNQAQGYR